MKVFTHCLASVLLFQAVGLAQGPEFTLRILLESGEHDDVLSAEEIINEVTILLPRYSDEVKHKLLLRRAQAYYHAGRYAEAASDLHKGMRLNAKSAQCGTLLARTLASMGKHKEAAQILAGVIKDHPRDARALSEYATFLFDEGREAEGLLKLRESIEADPKNWHAYLIRAIWFNNNGKYERALKDTDAALIITPWSDGAGLFALRAYILVELGRYEESISCAQVAVRLDKDNKTAHLCLSLASRNLGKWHSSAKYCMELYKRWPEDPDVAAECIDSLLNVGLSEKALEVARKAVKNLKRHGALYRALGRVFLWQRNYAESRRFYKESVDINERNHGALSDLSYFLSSCPEASFRDGQEATKLATRACELSDWREAWHIIVLANAWAETGDFAKAQQYAGMAVKLVQTHPNSYIRTRIQQMKALFDKNQPHRASVAASVGSP